MCYCISLDIMIRVMCEGEAVWQDCFPYFNGGAVSGYC
jgi:hypothetical protein